MQLYGEDEEDDNEELFSTIALATQVVQSIEARANGTIPLDHADHSDSCVDDDTQVDSVMVDPTHLGLGGLHVGPDFEFLVSPVASIPVPGGFPTPLGPPLLSPIDVDPPPVVISPVLGFCGEAAQLHPFSGPEGTHSPAFLEALLEKLRLLPVVGTVPTYNFIPKSLTRRYGKLAAVAFRWWFDEVQQNGTGSNDESRIAATLFLHHFDYIISRDTQMLDERHKLQVGQEKDYIHCAKIVRERMQRMEQGYWLDEVAAAVSDSEQAQNYMNQQRVVPSEADAEKLQIHNFETSIYKIMSGDTRTGHRVLKSCGVHPTSEETCNLLRSKFISDPEGDTMVGRAHYFSERTKKCKAPHVTDSVVSKVIGNLKDCKAAGISGWRNSRLKAIASSPEGLAVLVDWVRWWVAGKIPQCMAQSWRSVLGIPLRKGDDGEGVRPILIGEALMSLPGACLLHVVQSKATKLLRPTQFGIGVVAAPECMMALCKALARLRPEHAIAALDMINAFGEISRAEVFEEVLEFLPEIAPFVLQLWGTEGTDIYCANGASTWNVSKLVDGLFQGHNLSSLLFCLGLRRAMRRFQSNCDPCVQSSVHVEYIDDLIMQFLPHLTHLVMPVLGEALASVNLRLNAVKCKAMIPSAPAGSMHPSLVEFNLPQVHGSMDLLGGALEGEYMMELRDTSFASVPSASMKRIEGVEALSKTLIKILQTPLSRASHRAVWTLVDKVLNKALDYDARILSPELFSSIAVRLDQTVREVLLKLVHVVDFTEDEERCIRMSINKGGCGIFTSASQKS